MPYSAISAGKNLNSSWHIEEQCPQCGAPIILEEADRILTCSFCRVRLYILSAGFSRYYLPPAENITDEIIYAPYWRFRGMSFSFRQCRVENRIIDTSRLALGRNILPSSLGFRPQTRKLRFLEPDPRAKFLKRKISLKKIMAEITASENAPRGTNTAAGFFHRGFIGETVSLIYAPFYLKDYKFYDAILREPVKTAPEPKRPRSIPLDSQTDWKRTFLPTLCPLCGWDMGGEKESCVLVCTGCGNAWKATPSGFKRMACEIVTATGENILHVPFWKMETRIQAMELSTYSDLARLVNLPKVPQKTWPDQKLHFWSPGFKIAPQIFLRLSRQLTLANLPPQKAAGARTAGISLFPVTLPATEAAESVRITLFQLCLNREKVYSQLPQAKITVLNRQLVYLPFIIRANEIVQHHLRFSISKNALNIGRRL